MGGINQLFEADMVLRASSFYIRWLYGLLFSSFFATDPYIHIWKGSIIFTRVYNIYTLYIF